VLRARTAGDYGRLELKPRAIVPDFDFTDLAGKRGKLSDYAGKFVLLDFWASWCPPCLADVPYLSEAASELGKGKLVVLGMNVDDDEAKARKAVAEKQAVWRHASYPSIRSLVDQQFRIMAYPTYVLIDGRRRIVFSDDEHLRREKLLPYLRSVTGASK
jgi:thiol-disulfide isomerase/thioredoxin